MSKYRAAENMGRYIPSEIEKRWQEAWRKAGLYRVDLKDTQKKYYLLVELPYPSGDLHMGHWFTFAVSDILGRMKRMQGYNVFFPVGFDAFGLPAENAAIKHGINPREWTLRNIEAMKKQFATMGAMHDFEHGMSTSDADYYRWNQWIFLKMFEKGLAYRGKTLSNWCPKDQTVLANENVEAGKCWRCGTEVIRKEVEQWFLKITDYAERLIWPEERGPFALPISGPVARSSHPTSSASSKSVVNLNSIPGLRALDGTPSARATRNVKSAAPRVVDWPQSVREGQNNWIGKSEGIEIKFKVQSSKLKVEGNSSKLDEVVVFTKFPETIFGVTFMAVAPENPIVASLLSSKFKIKNSKFKEIKAYIESARRKSELERTSLEKDKTGVFTGIYCINPMNNESVPIWVADYVIGSYGTGAVMGVPGSDVRDYDFAVWHELPVVRVIANKKGDTSEIKGHNDVLEEGFIVNSGQFDGLVAQHPAKEKFMDFLEQKGFGQRKVNYHLHDWSISRQRYWGTPIPIIHCSNCGTVPVPEKDLPVMLPEIKDYAPKGKPPLATAEEWVNVKCPNCGIAAKREVDTMDTFVDSSWYFLRYVDPKDEKWIFDKRIVAKWLPVELYVGGAEHTLGHTLYSRFFVKFLHDIGEVPFDEYAYKRIHHGVILGPDGQRMSKSHGNVVNPDEQVAQFGADAVRMYLAFMGPYDLVAPWNPNGLRGVYHFLQRVWDMGTSSKFKVQSSKLSAEDLYWLHKTVKKVTEDVEATKYNTAAAALMEFLNYLSKKNHEDKKVSKLFAGIKNYGGVTLEEYRVLLLLLAPFAPHMTEELWQQLKTGPATRFRSIHQELWPSYDEKYIKAEKVTIVVQVNGKVRDSLLVEAEVDQKTIEKLALESGKVQKFLGKKPPRKVIYVPGKLVNLVI